MVSNFVPRCSRARHLRRNAAPAATASSTVSFLPLTILGTTVQHWNFGFPASSIQLSQCSSQHVTSLFCHCTRPHPDFRMTSGKRESIAFFFGSKRTSTFVFMGRRQVTKRQILWRSFNVVNTFSVTSTFVGRATIVISIDRNGTEGTGLDWTCIVSQEELGGRLLKGG